ncbi:MAG: sigma-70 family RNA polymerase sigma factor [Terriglobales bacterium]|jgi:RNA polymerase sigma-70 factor, ECF subfamily
MTSSSSGLSAYTQYDRLTAVPVAFFWFAAIFEIMQPPATASCHTIEPESSVSANDDQTDVERVLSGDIPAFEGLVRRWQGPLVNLAYRFCHDRGRAEEMAQEAFLRAYRALGQWRKDAVFSTWLFALATNLYRSELRRIPARTVPIEDVPEPRDPRPSDGGLEEHDSDVVVRRAVGALPPKYREALVLFYFHEMDVTTAARSLGLPEGTVKARLSRGREILRSKLPQLLTVQRLKEAI